MCSISMLAPLFCGAANRRGAAAKPAPTPRVFLRKSRLFFMVLPHQELENPVSSRNSMDIGYRGDAGRHQIAAFAMRLLARRSENSDAENAERRTVCRGRVWWAAVRTPCGCGIGWRKVGGSIQDDGAAFDYRHLRNTLSRSVKTFLCDAIRLTRMRH